MTRTALVSGTPAGYQGGSAIYVDGGRSESYNIDIFGNDVHGNIADGISVGDEVPEQGDVHDIRIYNNVVRDNGKKGINGGSGAYIGNNASEIEVSSNTFDNNVQAINVDGNSFTGGYKPHDISIINNILANSKYRNGYIGNTKNVTLKDNLFTSEFDELFQSGQNDNFQESNNEERTDKP